MSRTTPASNTNEPELRTTMLNLTPEQFQEIRQAYFQTMEGLHVLAESLERFAPAGDGSDCPMINEHLIVCTAIEAMKKSVLGRIV